MQNGIRRSKLELRGSREDLRVGSKRHPSRPPPGRSASFCALSPTVTMKRAGWHAGGASRGGPGGRSSPGGAR
eukprot:3797954-Alexandrium_andersonii.AAC.1